MNKVIIDSNVELPQYITDSISSLVTSVANTDIRVMIEEYKEKRKRSLNSNAYFHLICDKLADKLNVSKPFMKNQLLIRYGQLSYQNGSLVTLIVKDEIDVSEWVEMHLRPTSRVKTLDDGSLYRVYLLLRGSSTFTVEEMRTLIQGTVDEAKQVGIETMTPDELERMIGRWKSE